jgi:hypothetical protein
MSPQHEKLAGATERDRVPAGFLTFSPEQRAQLTKNGYVIYQLTGLSITDLRRAGRTIQEENYSLREFDSVRNEPSMRGEVAFSPKALRLALITTTRMSLSEQLAGMAKYSNAIEGFFPGVVVKLGNVADYVNLAFAHEDATGDYLFADNYDRVLTTTTTMYRGRVMGVGYFGQGNNLCISECSLPDKRFGAAPLIVPGKVKKKHWPF